MSSEKEYAINRHYSADDCERDEAQAMSFTPGPWKAIVHDDHIARIWHDGKEICKLPLVDTPIRHTTTGFAPGYDLPMNARLIAAAPDLLEALDELVRLDNEHGSLLNKEGVGNELVSALHAARVAIQKATQP